MKRILFIFGTRPEAIKLSPVILRMRASPEFDIRTCATAQHRGLLDQALAAFGIAPGHDLNLMRPGQTLAESTARIVSGVDPVLAAEAPDLVLVQGDTTTTFAAALAAFYRRIPVGHVEAGLRTGDFSRPFPEELNRVLATRLATLHFAATEGAARHLEAEGVPRERIRVTGNTGVDAVLHVAGELEAGRLPAPAWPWLDPSKRLIVVTAHRRESFGEGFESICRALARLGARGDAQIVYPVHPNPNVDGPVRRALAGAPNVVLIDPLAYVPFVDLMRRAHFLLTDSGGIQEEAPSLGKPVLVMRETTERPEAVEAGTAVLVGAAEDRIVGEASLLLDDADLHRRRSRIHNPYGDGRAGERIAAAIRESFE